MLFACFSVSLSGVCLPACLFFAYVSVGLFVCLFATPSSPVVVCFFVRYRDVIVGDADVDVVRGNGDGCRDCWGGRDGDG